MNDRKWIANWIEFNPHPSRYNTPSDIIGNGAPIFYKKFHIDKKPKQAQILISGLGFYQLSINGKQVGDKLLCPAFTAYDKTVFYNTYSVEDFLVSGENLIEVVLGNGWFLENQETDWEFNHATWRTRHQLICELFADDALVVKSDSSWLCGKSKTVFNSLRCGETYDNTAEIGEYVHATVAHGPGGVLKEEVCQPIRIKRIVSPVDIKNNIYDFGINLTGNIEITVKGNRGDMVSIEYSERLGLDGDIDISQIAIPLLRSKRFQKDEYILSGNGEETWHSKFGYNGFRYAKISGDAEIISVKARHFHTDLETAGSFECNNPFFNQLQSAIVHSTLCNFHHIPTDCPQREKNGWTGDAHLSCEQAMFNLDMYQAYLKWLDDIVDCQRPNGAIPCIVPTSVWGYNWGTGNAWDAALFEIPWQMYCFYGKKDILERYQPAMKKYLAFLEKMCDEGIWKNGLGDWCFPAEAKVMSLDSILTGYAYRMVSVYAKTCKILGFNDEFVEAENWSQEIRKKFIETFEDKEADSQGLLSMQLYFNLTDKPDEIFKRLVDCIVSSDYHIQCGISGIKWMFTTLSRYGRHDIACKILETDDYPGYKDMLRHSNGTLSENWTCTQSLNHHMYSSIGEWFYKCVAGINYDESNPGFKHIIITPHICENYSNFKAWHNTPYGKVIVEFKDGSFNISIPDDCTADFIFEGTRKQINY